MSIVRFTEVLGVRVTHKVGEALVEISMRAGNGRTVSVLDPGQARALEDALAESRWRREAEAEQSEVSAPSVPPAYGVTPEQPAWTGSALEAGLDLDRRVDEGTSGEPYDTARRAFKAGARSAGESWTGGCAECDTPLLVSVDPVSGRWYCLRGHSGPLLAGTD